MKLKREVNLSALKVRAIEIGRINTNYINKMKLKAYTKDKGPENFSSKSLANEVRKFTS